MILSSISRDCVFCVVWISRSVDQSISRSVDEKEKTKKVQTKNSLRFCFWIRLMCLISDRLTEAISRDLKEKKKEDEMRKAQEKKKKREDEPMKREVKGRDGKEFETFDQKNTIVVKRCNNNRDMEFEMMCQCHPPKLKRLAKKLCTAFPPTISVLRSLNACVWD